VVAFKFLTEPRVKVDFSYVPNSIANPHHRVF
jgi:hypothetical protein